MSWLGRLFRRKQTRQYTAASTAPRLSRWTTGARGPNIEVTASVTRLRDRARDLVRNNPHARKIIETLVTYIIGTGIRPIWRTGDQALDARVQSLWDRWATDQVTAPTPIPWEALQAIAVRAWLTDGEVLIRRRYRGPDYGLAVPLQVQLLEADYLDTSRDRPLDQRTGRVIVGGIEFDQLDNRRAYWLFPGHPGELWGTQWQSQAVPAEQIAHLYQELRPGQARGVPWLAPVMVALWDFSGYQDAERVRKRAEACVMAFVTNANPDEAAQGEIDGLGATVASDARGNPIEELDPGLIAYLPPYKDVKFHVPAATQGFAEYARITLQEIAAGALLPYELLTGDLSQVNFTSMRMGMVQFRQLVRMLRRQVVIPMLCRPVMRWWMDGAVALGILPQRDELYYPAWSEPAIEEVDRLREAQADLAELRQGTSSWRELVTAKGKDPDALLAEIAAERVAFARLGVKLDSDPNQTTKAGDAPAVREA